LGHQIAAFFGSIGGYDGLQAEHARVPLADFNLLKIPNTVSDEAALSLSDIICTAYHGLMNAEVDANTKSLAIWGAGPVGLLAIQLARYLGAKRVISIDHHDYRLDLARKLGAETLNFDNVDVVKTLHSMFPNGIEKCLDCAGFRFSQSLLHRGLRAFKLESDSSEIIEEMVKVCKKGGTISLIGEYIGAASVFPICPLMEKGITLRSGHVWVHKYWHSLLQLIENGTIDPTIVITHQIDLSAAPEAYKTLKARQGDTIKVLLKTKFYDSSRKSGSKSFNPKTVIETK